MKLIKFVLIVVIITLSLQFVFGEPYIVIDLSDTWHEVSFDEPRQYLDKKYKSKSENSTFWYGVADILSDPVFNASSFQREDINIDIITKSELNSLYDDGMTFFRKKPIAGKWYYYSSISDSSIPNLKITLYKAISIEYGYLYYYQLLTYNDEIKMNEFDSIISTVDIPKSQLPKEWESDELDSNIEEANIPDNNNNSKIDLIKILFIVLPLIMLSIFIYVVFRKKYDNQISTSFNHCTEINENNSDTSNDLSISINNKHGIQGSKVLITTYDENNNNEMICNICNKHIPTDSLFCPFCGSEVERNIIETSYEIPMSENDQPNSKEEVQLDISGFDPQLRRVFMLIEDGDFDVADKHLENYLNNNPENTYAYLGKVLIENRVTSIYDLLNIKEKSYLDSKNYKRMLMFKDNIIEDIFHA